MENLDYVRIGSKHGLKMFISYTRENSWCIFKIKSAPLTGRRSNQFILKEISPEYSLEGLMLKLKLQSFGHLMRRANSVEKPWCWERLKAGGEGDDRGWDGWMSSPDSMDMSLSNLQKMVKDRKVWCVEVRRVAKSWTCLSNWTELNRMSFYIHFQL